MNYKFTIKTESPLLTGSGEGGVLIDADVVFHQSGFPFIPAKRVKGMLKESLEEVLEIAGEENLIASMIESLFGVSGKQTHTGKLLFGNLFVSDWEEISSILQNNRYHEFQPHVIKAFFTTEIQQTAIEKNGIAKDRSLRNYRVIKPGNTFEGLFSSTRPLDNDEWKYLQIAVANLRHAGTRRNRGFGKIHCEIEAVTGTSPSVQHVSTSLPATGIEKLSISIKTCSPVVLARQLGEQNTVFTRRFISGSRIRGMLAAAYIRQMNLNRSSAQTDKKFHDIFLSGNVRFGNLFLNHGAPIPSHIQKRKIPTGENDVICVFDEAGQTTAIAPFGHLENGTVIHHEDYNPRTEFFFHNSREDRAAGRSTATDAVGGIFYYEALAEDQFFYGQISGDNTLLAQLLKTLPAEFSARLGRSKAAQYGEISVSLEPLETDPDLQKKFLKGAYILTLQSPLILLNKCGYVLPDTDALLEELNQLSNGSFKLKDAVAKVGPVELYNTVWESKSGKQPAYLEGSVFYIELEKEITLADPLQFLGEWNELGFGRVELQEFTKGGTYTMAPEKRKDPLSHVKDKTGNDLLNKIIKNYQSELAEVKIRTAAIESASRRAAVLNNHLISRMERLFEIADSSEEIDQWVAKAKGRPAGMALKNAGLVGEDGEKFDFGKLMEKKAFPLQKAYWITFFQTLRKMNKTNDISA